MKGLTLARANMREKFYMILTEELGLPFMPWQADKEKYENLAKFVELTSPKVVKNFMTQFSKFKDYKTIADLSRDLKIRNFFSLTKEKSPEILSIFYNFTNEFHEIYENLPYLNIKIDKEELMKVFNIIKKYRKEDFLRCLKFLNYGRLRKKILLKAKKSEINLIIDKITSASFKRQTSLRARKEFGENWREIIRKKEFAERSFQNTTYISKLKHDELEFIKDPIKASFWGNETLCCLKIGGAAAGLLKPIECSPLAGEVVGKFKSKKTASYVWDMLEINNGIPEKALIIDNIEVAGRLNETETEKYLEIYKKLDGYKNIYLGTIRNDCNLPMKYVSSVKKRQSVLVGYENLYATSIFAGADSRELYTIDTREDDKVFTCRKMNYTDLHTIKYLEEFLYPNVDPDFIYNIDLETPSYIIDSTTHVAGYFVTRFKYFKKNETDFSQKNEIKKIYLEDNKTYIKKFYIEDIVLSPNKKIISCLSWIIDDFVAWLKNHNIDTVMVNSNDDSKLLLKRLIKNGINVEAEKLFTITPKNKINHLPVEEVNIEWF